MTENTPDDRIPGPDCPWCENVPRTFATACSVLAPSALICSRAVGHDDDHAACGGPESHPIQTWPASPDDHPGNAEQVLQRLGITALLGDDR